MPKTLSTQCITMKKMRREQREGNQPRGCSVKSTGR